MRARSRSAARVACVLLGAMAMHASGSSVGAWCLTVLAGALGCTVGGDSNGTLSGGASASASAGETAGSEAPGTDDGANDSTDHGGGGEASEDTSGTASTDAATTGDADASTSAGASDTTADDGAASSEDGSSSDSGGDLDDGILDVTIIAHDDCTITTIPASITVPEGTEFTVNWISSATSEAPVDVAKIDPFNAVPIILGMEPGTSYHDEVREWCGDLFTGTFDFEITSCFDPHWIPVDCSG